MWAGYFTLKKHDFSAAQRREDAKHHIAMPDGSFPIKSKEDLEHAVSLAHTGKHPFAKVKAHIVRRARALDATAQLPKDWDVKKEDGGDEDDVDDADEDDTADNSAPNKPWGGDPAPGFHTGENDGDWKNVSKDDLSDADLAANGGLAQPDEWPKKKKRP